MNLKNSLPLLLAAASLALCTQASAKSRSVPTVFVDEFKARYPDACEGAAPGKTGLCLLVSVKPKARGGFAVRPLTGGQPSPMQTTVTPNVFLALPAGAYQLTKTGGIDDHTPSTVTVQEGQIATVKTMTLKFTTLARSRAYKLQRFQARTGTQNGGCAAEFPHGGVHAFIPGNYVLNLAGKDRTPQKCQPGGVSFNAMAGQAYRVKAGQVMEQALETGHIHRHPNQVSALTSVSPYNHGIDKLGWLPRWGRHQGLQNPGSKALSALVLSGPGSYRYVVPFRFIRKHPKVCGRSLSLGGMGALDMLTDCTFEQDRLTGFTVNRGAYATYHNLHPQTGISANFINNSFTVANVRFKLP